ncbi:MAG TPA: hypothetical protein VHX39_22705, partial [Acetobacteraceae bacterium]|nr:hypothetical protein [Acetobacteraceae bacterium]
MNALHKPASGTLCRFGPFALRTRPWRIAIEAQSATHLLFSVIHWRRRRRGLWLLPRQAHSLALI